MTSAETIVAAAVGCTAFWQLIDHLIERHKAKKFDMQAAIESVQKDVATCMESQTAMQHSLTKIEKDSVRSQLMSLMSDYPDNKQEIMTVAQHYFADIHGNWYMTALFNEWLEKEGIGKPEWFKG